MAFIDRDPEKMMQYSKQTKEDIERVKGLLKKIDNTLNQTSSYLDGPAQKAISSLHENIELYSKQMEKLTEFAHEIYELGKRQKMIQEEGV